MFSVHSLEKVSEMPDVRGLDIPGVSKYYILTMKKRLSLLCLGLCLSAFIIKPVYANLSPQKIRELYASLPFEARGVYNQKVRISFAQLSAVNGFFSAVFSQKIEKISSPKINFTPKMTGWTALVFKTIYKSANSAKGLPTSLSQAFGGVYESVVSAAGSAAPQINLATNHFKIAPFILALFLSISILPLHKIKFRLFIQRE